MNDQPEGAGERDVLFQNPDEIVVSLRHEVMEDADAAIVQNGMELDMHAGAGEVRHEVGIDQRDVVELLVEDEIGNVGDAAQALRSATSRTGGWLARYSFVP